MNHDNYIMSLVSKSAQYDELKEKIKSIQENIKIAELYEDSVFEDYRNLSESLYEEAIEDIKSIYIED